MIMKLKYYIRGLGIGILITTIVLSVGGKKEKLTDKEIIARARELGMVMNEDKDDDLQKVLGKSSDKDASGQDKSDNKGADSEVRSNESDRENASEQENEASGPDNNTNTDINKDITDAPSDDKAADSDMDSTEATGNDNITEADGGSTDTDTDSTGVSSDDNAAEADTDNADVPSDNNNEADGDEPTQVEFTIVRGMSSRQVSELLAQKGLVENSVDFDDYIKRQGKASVIKVGTYTLPKDADYKTILKAITG